MSDELYSHGSWGETEILSPVESQEETTNLYDLRLDGY